MPRQSLNVDMKIMGGKKCKVRKRGYSSSSSSTSFVQNYRLKRMFLLGKKGGSTTPVPLWKMMNSESQTVETDKGSKILAGKNEEKAKLPISARKLGAVLWEINGMPSPKMKSEAVEDRVSEVGMRVKKERILESSMELGLSCPVSVKSSSHRRRASAGSQKLLQTDCNLPLHNCLVKVDQAHHQGELRNRLKDIHGRLVTSKELLKLLSRVHCLERFNSTSAPFVSALKVELDQVFTHVDKLIQRQNKKSLFEEENKIQSTITSITRELETEKKSRIQTERLNKKLGRELSGTKASLSRASKELESERRARRIVQKTCDELARCIGEDKLEVDELKRQSAEVLIEVEKEREMFQLADVIREERVKMKLSEAKYLLEEKNAFVDKLRNELKSQKGEADDDSSDNDLHCIELNVDDLSKSFRWGSDGIKNGSKRSSVDKSKIIGKTKTNNREDLDVFDSSRGLFELRSSSSKDVEEEMERYKIIKDLRDNRIASSQELASSGQ